MNNLNLRARVSKLLVIHISNFKKVFAIRIEQTVFIT